MNKIIVVGHPKSSFEKVLNLLFASGMSPAKVSRREGFTPEQIGTALLKAHGAVPVEQVRSADELQQISVAPVWQGLALDLLLANMEQRLWGWADIQAVYLLDYWKVQDPQTMFVLVYGAPQSALTCGSVEQLETDPEALQAKVNAWVAYNSALLRFHLHNPERSLLVHADQVQVSATGYVQQLSARMDVHLQLHDASQSLPTPSGDHDGTQSVLHSEIKTNDTVDAASYAPSQLGLQSNVLAQWLIQQLLEEHPEASDLYAQLQAAASMPQQGHALLASHDLQQHRYLAWAAFVAQQTTVQQSAMRLAQLDKTMQEKQEQLHRSLLQIEQLQKTNLHIQHRVQEQEQELMLNERTDVLEASEQERSLLLKQLHKVHETLENRYLDAQEQVPKLAEIQKLQADLKAAQDIVTKLQQVEPQFKKELQQTVTKLVFTELQEENELLLNQLHQVQEELARYFFENQKLKAGGAAQKSESIRKLSVAEQYGAADRIKSQLSYRLGAIMIKKSRSLGGWLSMPFALTTETQRFRQELVARKGKKRPSIKSYCDAHEAERVKQHLSYRLGATMIQHSSSLSGWLSMPWALYTQVKEFRLSRC